jgi:hypothetical protein
MEQIALSPPLNGGKSSAKRALVRDHGSFGRTHYWLDQQGNFRI